MSLQEQKRSVSTALLEQMLGPRDLGLQLLQARESEGGGGRALRKLEERGGAGKLHHQLLESRVGWGCRR